ncbi:hypothetical protein FACS1894125_4760 [Actinomycetota bacterium]|nr:hypothetical protein FACS1894125_4760 [Actinomycetota bacterium]
MGATAAVQQHMEPVYEVSGEIVSQFISIPKSSLRHNFYVIQAPSFPANQAVAEPFNSEESVLDWAEEMASEWW